MWEGIRKILEGPVSTEYQIIKERLGKQINRSSLIKEAEEQIEVAAHEINRVREKAIPCKQLMDYWQDKSQPEHVSLVSLTHGPDHCITLAMNTSETLLQPGSAENFSLLRPHPIDELTARRARTTMHNMPSTFLRKTSNLQHIA